MIKFSKKVFLLTLFTVTSLIVIGCSTDASDNSRTNFFNIKTDILQVNADKKGLLSLLNDKYILYDNNQLDFGLIYYFTNDNIVKINNRNITKYKVINAISDNNSAIYELESLSDNNKMFLSLSRNNDGYISLNTDNKIRSLNDIEYSNKYDSSILDSKECIKTLLKLYPSFKHYTNLNNFGLTLNLFEQVHYELIQEHKNSPKLNEEDALNICKQSVKELHNSRNIFLGTDKPNFPKTIIKDDIEYYITYLIFEDGMIGDFCYYINSTTGEVYYVSSANMNNLVPIDNFIQSLQN